jgi:hypothetical protein
MGHGRDVEGVLITGVFGVGKSSVTAEIAELLEERGVAYAALDLDWLAWFDTGGDDRDAECRMMLTNLTAVVANYLAAGVQFFILARSIRDRSELDRLKAVSPMPLRVVRLDLPLEEIEQRLASDVTSGRQTDLRNAAAWIAASRGQGIGGLAVPNDRAIRTVAVEILDWLAWE